MPRPVILLGVNIDHAATLRQARYRDADAQPAAMVEPDPVAIALLAEKAGADGITAHLREDRRHIQDRDIRRLREAVATRLNLEMACTDEMVRIALSVKPDICCLVPENRQELTTEGGLDVRGNRARVAETVAALTGAGIPTSLFIDPDEESIALAAEVKSPVVEFHTGSFAHAYHGANHAAEFERLRAAAELAHQHGITVNAGHGINYANIVEIRTLPHLNELNIGHSILSRALFTGVIDAVSEMKRLMNERK
ncbi:MAG TPA: pyridoxine 5'-phosphate synthase [Opitutaceae bacterium]|nr:pyridoxine 5'-phosphate synthase [Opitutaceae bacterium]